MTTDYTCNEWLDDADRRMFERMRRENPRRYRVAGLGDWGVSEGLIFDRWEVAPFSVEALLRGDRADAITCVYGLDYGYTNDPTAFIAAAVDTEEKRLYVFDEHYQTRMVNSEIAAMIKAKGYQKERICADAAEPKSNEELRRAGISRLRAAEKGKDSVLHGIAVLQEYAITVHPLCKATAAELSSYCWDKDEMGRGINRPVDRDNHLMDALRYAMTDVRYRESPRQKALRTAERKQRRMSRGLSAAELAGGWNGG